MKIAIYGAGGFAREVAWLAESCDGVNGSYEVVCFIDDNESLWGQKMNGVSVIGIDAARQQFSDAMVVSGIGAPSVRQTTMEAAKAVGFTFATLIHPRTEYSRFVDFEQGVVICAGSILTTNISLGKHVQINLDCTIGHDVVLGDYTTLSPGVHVSGWVHVGERVYIGTGAVIINGTQDKPLVIGDNAIVGAGACVTKPVEPGSTVVGIPAVPIKRRN